MAGFKIGPRKPSDTIAEMTTIELVRAIPEAKLVGLVMQLTGGSANPVVVKVYIERVRKDGVWLGENSGL